MANMTSSTPSSREFQPGDRVICINNDGATLTLGSTYIVTRVAPSPLANEEYRVFLLGVTGAMWGYFPERFKLVPNCIYKRS